MKPKILYIFSLVTITACFAVNSIAQHTSIRDLGIVDFGVKKHILNREYENHPFNAFLYFCPQTGCALITKSESVMIIGGENPVAVTVKGRLINFQTPHIRAVDSDDAVEQGLVIYSKGYPGRFSAQHGFTHINLNSFLPATEDENLQLSSFNSAFTVAMANPKDCKLISGEIRNGLISLSIGENENDVYEIILNADFRIINASLNGKNFPVRLEKQYTNAENGKISRIEISPNTSISLAPTWRIKRVKISGSDAQAFFWGGEYIINNKGKTRRGNYSTISIPSEGIVWTGPLLSPENVFLSNDGTFSVCRIKPNYDIQLISSPTSNDRSTLNKKIENSFVEYIQTIIQQKQLDSSQDIDLFFENSERSFKINPKEYLGRDLQNLGILVSSFQIEKDNIDSNYDIKLILSSRTGIGGNKSFCNIYLDGNWEFFDCEFKEDKKHNK